MHNYVKQILLLQFGRITDTIYIDYLSTEIDFRTEQKLYIIEVQLAILLLIKVQKKIYLLSIEILFEDFQSTKSSVRLYKYLKNANNKLTTTQITFNTVAGAISGDIKIADNQLVTIQVNYKKTKKRLQNYFFNIVFYNNAIFESRIDKIRLI